jgi:hypothetical protein
MRAKAGLDASEARKENGAWSQKRFTIILKIGFSYSNEIMLLGIHRRLVKTAIRN